MKTRRQRVEAERYSAIAEVYPEVFETDSLREWKTGICRLLKKAGIQSGTVLDVGCGTGIGGQALSQIGTFTVDGIDRSPAMIARIPATTYRRVLCGNFQDVRVQTSAYSLVCCGFDTFNYAQPGERSAFMAKVKRVLTPGGIFALDVLSRSTISAAHTVATRSRRLPSRTVTQRSLIRPRSVITVFTVENLADRTIRSEFHTQYYCGMATLSRLAKAHGFSPLRSVRMTISGGLPLEKYALLFNRS